MSIAQKWRAKLDYLVRSTGRSEEEIVAEAMEAGMAALLGKQIGDAYLAGELDRAEAVAEIGEDAVAELDYARRAIEQDVHWGLKGA